MNEEPPPSAQRLSEEAPGNVVRALLGSGWAVAAVRPRVSG